MYLVFALAQDDTFFSIQNCAGADIPKYPLKIELGSLPAVWGSNCIRGRLQQQQQNQHQIYKKDYLTRAAGVHKMRLLRRYSSLTLLTCGHSDKRSDTPYREIKNVSLLTRLDWSSYLYLLVVQRVGRRRTWLWIWVFPIPFHLIETWPVYPSLSVSWW